MVLIDSYIDVGVIEVVVRAIPVSVMRISRYQYVVALERGSLRLVETDTMRQDLNCRIFWFTVTGNAKLRADVVSPFCRLIPSQSSLGIIATLLAEILDEGCSIDV